MTKHKYKQTSGASTLMRVHPDFIKLVKFIKAKRMLNDVKFYTTASITKAIANMIDQNDRKLIR